MAPVTLSEANGDTPAIGGLFTGVSFFLVQRVPSRSGFVDKIKANGGRVVKLEQQADYIIADHVRKDCPPGSISFTFIDSAIRNGALPEPEEHRAGPPVGAVRDVGSTIPGKQTRTAFTAEDDRVLWQWVQRSKEMGGSVKGNDIYKHLEARNSRHTFQAWRDRYIKKLMDKPPAGVEVTVAANAPPSPPEAQAHQQEGSGAPGKDEPEELPGFKLPRASQQEVPQADPPRMTPSPAKEPPEFDDDDFECLMAEAEEIHLILPSRIDEAWELWANAFPKHTVQRWRELWDKQVRPEYVHRRKIEKREAKKRKREPAVEEEKVVPDGPRSPVRTVAVEVRKPKTAPVRQETPTSAVEDVYSQKKRRPNGPPPLEGDVADVVIVDEEQVSRSAFQDQSRPVDAEAIARPEQDTSDRRDQIESALEEQGSSVRAQDVPLEIMPTSEANTDANQQLQRESLAPHDKNEEDALPSSQSPASQPGAEEVVMSDHLVEDDVMSGGMPLEEILDGNEGNNLLTEANLASQQLEHKAQLLRGADLPEDDDEHDQTDYVAYLQGLVTDKGSAQQGPTGKHASDLLEDAGNHDQTDYANYLKDILSGVKPTRAEQISKSGAPIAASAAERSQLNESFDSTHDDTAYKQNTSQQDRQHEIRVPPMKDMPVSSQQDIDDAIETNLHWPSSPDASQRTPQRQQQVQSQSMAFETQIPYPNLPSFDADEQADEDMFTTQPPLPQVTSPSASGSPANANFDTGLFFSSPAKQHNQQTPSQYQKPSEGFDENELPESDEDSQDLEASQDEIDLNVAEPEGGFGFSSSPVAKPPLRIYEQATEAAASVENAARASMQQVPQTEQEDYDNRPEHEDAMSNVNENYSLSQQAPSAARQSVIEVSSASSSSSPDPSSSDQQEDDESDDRNNAPAALETQDIVSAETQQPDFAMLLPPDSEDESEELPTDPLRVPPPSRPATNLPRGPQNHRRSTKRYIASSKQTPRRSTSSRPRYPPASQTQPINLSETQTLSADAEIETFLTTMNIRYKVPEATVIHALKCTSMRPELAELVVLERKAGRGLPNDIPGVWSERDDKVAEGGDANALKRLEEKHGGGNEVMGRLRFLDEWRAG
ncbi:hypothetical protein B0A50_04318 [Salinomyces thailandicus]|uniref:Telomeric repeat-binding factor 2-interacting protein 1 n=1 Tax=Salinomyces thailandicus TaxID=706561 RepID=A0A4U0TXU0_9PEZI|nr:hypothetical protein B0A50_04318 [Salinomyces thailandica]